MVREIRTEHARGLRRRAPEPGDTWFLDEVFIKIGGIRKYLWRAIDQDGNVLDVLVRSRRNAKAAKRFFGKLMRKQAPVLVLVLVLVTDKLASYVVAHRELMPSVEHRRSKYLNNRAENSHQPARQRERAMKFFRSPAAAQRFLAVFSAISPHFQPSRHKLTSSDYRSEMTGRFATWYDATGVPVAA
ncbi:MAG: transposase [Rhodococcus erythropolis]|nr:transposase [Rhodococcus erythropolis]